MLIENGYEAYVVGGCVRDSIMGKNITDYDITTSATPDEISNIFKKYNIRKYGAKHGTISIIYKGKMYEITTFREEEGYTDGRHPDKVSFVKDLKSDLSRRDFTINAMAADLNGNIIDYFNGLNDIKKGIIKTVGNPINRFKEDSLRIFRAIRFSLKLNFNIDKNTYRAMQDSTYLIKEHQLSKERIVAEIKEIFKYHNGYKRLNELGIVGYIFTADMSDVSDKILNAMNNLNNFNYETEIREKGFISDNFNIILHLSIIFHIKYKNKSIEQEFTNLPGLGKKIKQFVINLTKAMHIPDEVLNSKEITVPAYWLRNYIKKIIKLKEYNHNQFILLLYTGYCAIYSNFNKNELLNLKKNTVILTKNNIINGNEIKKYGFQGKITGIVIDFIQLSRYLKLIETQKDAIELLENIKSDNIDDIVKLINNYEDPGTIMNELLEKWKFNIDKIVLYIHNNN